MKSTVNIAKATGVSANYLARIFRKLHRADLVTLPQGRFGGAQLSRPASKISLLDVINAIEPIKRDSQVRQGTARATFARLDRTMDAIVGDTQKRLAATSLSDIAPRKR